jgi:diguanylate cyclase (GGDEF)-like protein
LFAAVRPALRRDRLPWLVAGAGLLFMAYYSAGLLLAGDAYLRIQSNVTYNLPAFAGLCLSIIPIRRSRGRERLGWICLALLLACWQTGDWIASYYDLVLGSETPVPGYADIAYYAGYLGFIGAVPLLVLPSARRRDPRWLLDAGIVVVVAGTAMSELLLSPIKTSGASQAAMAVAFGYPLLDLGLLGALVITLYASGHYSRIALVLCAATAVQVVTDSVYGYLVTHGGYDNLANPAELGWILAYLLLAVCFVLPEEKSAAAASTRPSMTGLLLPFAAALPLAAWTFERLLRAEASASLVAGTLATVALVTARQVLTMRDNLGLYRDLEHKSSLLELTLATEREQARRDPLTGALNHGAISDALRDLVSGVPTDAPMCAVAMVDIDGMKAVNDTYGHQAGDMVLITVASVLGHSGAQVGRYGGDEFVVILQGAGRDDAERYRDAVLDNLTRAQLVDPETQASIPVRVSVGLAIYPEEAQTVAELVGLSDSAMYAAKRERSVDDGKAGPRPMGDERAAKMVGELVPLLTSPGDVDSKLRLVAYRLSVGAGYDAVDFTLFAPTPGASLASNAFARVPADVLAKWKQEGGAYRSESHPLRVYLERSPRPLIIEDFTTSELVTSNECAILAAAGLRSGLVAPLIWQDKVVGLLAVASNRLGAFTAQDLQFVGNVATQVTAIVRTAQLVDELQAATARLAGAQADTVMMLAAAAEAHDRETGLHLLSIRTLAEALARELGYADAAVHDLGIAAVLHDIGKISVPDVVLSSSGSLQEDEWELMKRHTLWGAEFLRGVPGFELAATVARSHHERWDGGGYPDGLAADDIPEAAAIVTVADSFDAMTHDRPYKVGRSVEDAISEIVACSGEQFSPRVVEALLQLHQRGELPHAHARDAGEERAA